MNLDNEAAAVLDKLSNFFVSVSSTYARFMKEIDNDRTMSKEKKERLSKEAADKTSSAATPIIHQVLGLARAAKKIQSDLQEQNRTIQKALKDLEKEMIQKVRDEEKFSEEMRRECTAQVDECQSALKQAKKECGAKAAQAPRTVKEAQNTAASHLETLQRKFDTMVQTFQAEAKQKDKEVDNANKRADRAEAQAEIVTKKLHTAETHTKSLVAELSKMQENNKDLHQQIKQCRQDTSKIQKLESVARDAEDGFDECNKERVKLNQRLSNLSQRLEELEKTSKSMASHGVFEGDGEENKSFTRPKPPSQRRPSTTKTKAT